MVEPGIVNEVILTRETPQLISLLKEMKYGLDSVRSNVQSLTQKVKQGQLLTAEGMSYLEAKHLLLLNYCQSIIYYTLRKAKGKPIEDHPVVRSLVEIKLFLEKIRPIDKKLDYQVQKLIRAASGVVPAEGTLTAHEELKGGESKDENPLKYRPNPDMLVSKTSQAEENGSGLYRPPKFAPTSMDNDKMSKEEKQAIRRNKELLRQTKQSSYMKELMDEFEDRPEEVREIVGLESRELSRYIAKREEQSRQEEELFTRAPVTKREKKFERHMKSSRNGLLSLTDDFFNEVGTLSFEEKEKGSTPYSNSGGTGKIFKKRKRH